MWDRLPSRSFYRQEALSTDWKVRPTYFFDSLLASLRDAAEGGAFLTVEDPRGLTLDLAALGKGQEPAAQIAPSRSRL